MTNLYLAPVSDEWMGRFEETVEKTCDLSDAPVEIAGDVERRVWGTTAGPMKRTFFEDMEADDAVFFYHDGEFFASARVAETFESSEFGDWLWDNPESSLIYLLEDYQCLSLPRENLVTVLGYDEAFAPQGFVRVSEDAQGAFLQEYNSIEEGFQDLRDEYGSGGDGPEEPDSPEDPVREHTEIQWYLIQLGLKHGYDVHVAINDQNLTYDGHRLGEECVDNLTLAGFSDATLRIIEYVDVIWLDGDYIANMFEVESTTSIYSGILRMTDFVVKVPNLAVDMYIVAPEEEGEKARRQMNRPTFQRVLDPTEHSSLRYVSFDTVRERYELVEQAGPLQSVF